MKLEKFINNFKKFRSEIIDNNKLRINSDILFNKEELLNINIEQDFDSFINEGEFSLDEIFREDFINTEALDKYINENSLFKSWNEMLEYFLAKYIEKKLFLEG